MSTAQIVPTPRGAALDGPPTCAACGYESLAKPVYVALDGRVLAMGAGCAALLVYGAATNATLRKAARAQQAADEAAEIEAREQRAVETRAVIAWALVQTGLVAEHAEAALPGAVSQRAVDHFGGLEAARAAFRAAAAEV